MKFFKIMLITAVFGLMASCKNMDGTTMNLLQPSDQAITSSIYNSFQQNSMLENSKIQVHTHDRKVTLTGRVGSRNAR